MQVKYDKRWIVILLVVLNSIGFSLVIPLLPFLLDGYLPAEHLVFGMGLLFSVYAICSFITAPILGTLSDRYGRKPLLIGSLLGSVLGYILLGIGGALWILFLGRIIDGLTAGNISILFAYISDNSKPNERSKWYGYIGAAMGIGKIGGPTLGAFLSTYAMGLPFYFTALFLFLSTLVVYFWLPESKLKEQQHAKLQLHHLNPFQLLFQTLGMPPVRLLLGIGLLFYLTLTVFQFNITLFLKDIYTLDVMYIGLLLTLVGGVEIASRGFLLPWLLRYFTPKRISTWGLISLALGFGCIALSVYLFSLVLIGLSLLLILLGEGLFEPTYLSNLSNQVSPDQQGKIQGVNQSMQSLIQIAIPLLAGSVYFYSPSLLYTSASLVVIFALLLFQRNPRTK